MTGSSILTEIYASFDCAKLSDSCADNILDYVHQMGYNMLPTRGTDVLVGKKNLDDGGYHEKCYHKG